MSRNAIPFVDAAEIRAACTFAQAADAIEAALRAGLDPEAAPARTVAAAGHGQLLVMPSAVGPHLAVKLVTVGGAPWVQGVVVVFDVDKLAPIAMLDGVALTTLRTPAVSLMAARHLVRGTLTRMTVFGCGPQGVGHAEALGTELGLKEVTFVTRTTPFRTLTAAVREADLVCCATNAREPLFDGTLVADDALVVAVGSHEPTARELDTGLMRRSTVVVESRRSALREAGEVTLTSTPPERLYTLADIVSGRSLPERGPRVFKSTGMAWEDTVVASAVLQAVRPTADRSDDAPA